jgi:hypothetical protein
MGGYLAVSPKALVALLNDRRARCAPLGAPTPEPQPPIVS